VTSLRLEHSLLHDDALVVRADESLASFVAPWLPLHASPPRSVHERGATIDVVADGATAARDASASGGTLLLRFGGVRVLASDDGTLRLAGTSAVHGRIDLDARRATLSVPVSDATDAPDAARSEAPDPRVGFDVYSMLTLAAAFLVGRLGGALVHAGGVVDPDGRAWLLVGDTHAGKTTTCVSLVAFGAWRYLADDQVVLRVGDDGALDVEGWPRHAHLDEGWTNAVVTGSRAAVDLRARWGDRWVARAPLGGLLMPMVDADRPTSLAVAADATAFAALVRQSPWLMADRTAATDVLALLRDAASHPTFALSLGRDGYARGDVLTERLEPARAASTARQVSALVSPPFA
jgi:hypothetical protein